MPDRVSRRPHRHQHRTSGVQPLADFAIDPFSASGRDGQDQLEAVGGRRHPFGPGRWARTGLDRHHPVQRDAELGERRETDRRSAEPEDPRPRPGSTGDERHCGRNGGGTVATDDPTPLETTVGQHRRERLVDQNGPVTRRDHRGKWGGKWGGERGDRCGSGHAVQSIEQVFA